MFHYGTKKPVYPRRDQMIQQVCIITLFGIPVPASQKIRLVNIELCRISLPINTGLQVFAHSHWISSWAKPFVFSSLLITVRLHKCSQRVVYRVILRSSPVRTEQPLRYPFALSLRDYRRHIYGYPYTVLYGSEIDSINRASLVKCTVGRAAFDVDADALADEPGYRQELFCL